MSYFAGTVFARRINTGVRARVFIEKCTAILEIEDGSEMTEKAVRSGDMIIDPVTDDEVKVISATGNGFYVEDFHGERKVIPLADAVKVIITE